MIHNILNINNLRLVFGNFVTHANGIIEKSFIKKILKDEQHNFSRRVSRKPIA